jgi:hypothetical protein
MVKTVTRFLICLLIVGVVGCTKEFKELDGPTFKKMRETSNLQSALVWMYLGEKNGFHFFVLDTADIQNNYYKVSKKYIEVALDKPKEITLDEDQWIGLEITQIKFKD